MICSILNCFRLRLRVTSQCLPSSPGSPLGFPRLSILLPGLITAVLLALPSMALAYNFLSHGAEAGNTSFQPLAQSVAKRCKALQSVAKRCKEPNAFKASISLTNSAAPWHVRLAPLRLPRPRRGPHVATVFSLHPLYF